jgi:hypothetical protein
MYFDRKIQRFIAIAIVQGGVGGCNNIDFPGIYVRLDYPSILSFIEE